MCIRDRVGPRGVAQDQALVALDAGRGEQRAELPALLVGVARHLLARQRQDLLAGQPDRPGRRGDRHDELGRIAAGTPAVVVLTAPAVLRELDADRADGIRAQRRLALPGELDRVEHAERDSACLLYTSPS